jgi:hypothetical protein
MPRVAIKTGILREDGTEEILQEYLCDWPGCPNVAEHLLGVLVELRAMAIVCTDHMATLHKRGQSAD